MGFASYIEADDIIEGTVAGGIAGVVEYTIAAAVAALPGAFLTLAEVVPFSVIVGALSFGGVILFNGRAKRKAANS